MKANLATLEPKIFSRWKELNIYQRLRQARKGKQKFILHDGPPYANGLIHIGHALNKILKDIVVKYKIMRGYDSPFIVGWDCHGLPVEHQLCKELNVNKNEVRVIDFRKRAKDFALRFVALQRQDFERLGVLSDWENPYLTLNLKYEYAVIKLLEHLVKAGYVYRGLKPVNWCSSCETALAEAEVEYLDKESDSIYALFAVIDDKGLFKKQKVYFLVWTTTAWTLIANVAIAVHPDSDYSLVSYQNFFIVVAKALISQLEEKLATDLRILDSFKGDVLEGIKTKHPFFERTSTVVLADFVSKEEGSGCVHIAPGHGEEDFSLTKKYNLPVIMPVNEKGIFDEPPEFKASSVDLATKKVLERLDKGGSLIKHEKITHSYPHCWRCKQPIIFRATFQWFLDIDHRNLRQKLLSEVERIQWVPASGKERMRAMLLTRPHWCLSRQRLWGIPIGAVHCNCCGEVILDSTVLKRVAEVFAQHGSDAWFTLDVRDFLPLDFVCPKCKGREFAKEFDILDVWFESGASFFAVLKNHAELNFPADIYLEGSDQHRGWFQVSLIPSVATQDSAPFKIILTHGFVVDGLGRKMSKSLGNVIAPQEIIKEYGAEVLRLWVAYSDYSEDIKISKEIISQFVDMYRKIRNTIRFILGNLYDFMPAKHTLGYAELLEVDRYMLSKTMQVFSEIIEYYDAFSFYKVCQRTFTFANIDLSSFYLDILKDRLYTFSSNSIMRRSAQFVLSIILKVLLKSIAPILSFTAEEAYALWSNASQAKDSIFMATLDEDVRPEWIDRTLIQKWESKLLPLRDRVLKEIEIVRSEGAIGSSLESEVVISVTNEDYDFYSKYRDILRELFIVSYVTVTKGEYAIMVKKASGAKCGRCWNYNTSVGLDKEHPQLCSRCTAVIKEMQMIEG